ncbi:MAG: energy-coupling factor ABC transporter substrate-binding protein [Clostridia bacterium]|nr:MAG: energy-coupling factor ABC transporter substrate-binding protein [Clostridia bacterium]
MRNVSIGLLAVFLLALPLVLNRGAEFAGSDGQAQEAITAVAPGYQPWFSSLWQPPSPEVETLLFSLQAAAGAGFVGYYLGYVQGWKKAGERGKYGSS